MVTVDYTSTVLFGARGDSNVCDSETGDLQHTPLTISNPDGTVNDGGQSHASDGASERWSDQLGISKISDVKCREKVSVG